MQQQAYDFAMFESDTRTTQKSGVQLRSVAGGKKPQTRGKKLAGSLGSILASAMFLALAVLLIQSKVTITELNAETRKTRDALTTAQSAYNYLSSELDRRTGMENIESIANRLGLMKIDDSQITYVRLEESSVLTTAESPVKKWTDWLSSGLLSLMETLDP